MARKTTSFSLSLETYDRLKAIFPDVVGTDDNMQLLLNAYEHQGDSNDGAIDDLKRRFSELQDEYDKLLSENDSLKILSENLENSSMQLSTKDEEIAALQAQVEEYKQSAQTTEEGNERLALTIRELNNQIKAYEEKITDLESKEINWPTVATIYDPAYVLVLEEVTKRLNNKFNLSLSPHNVLMTFFLKYYYNHEVEFDGMPFVISPKEILSIVQQVYPDMMAGTLRKALSV